MDGTIAVVTMLFRVLLILDVVALCTLYSMYVHRAQCLFIVCFRVFFYAFLKNWVLNFIIYSSLNVNDEW